MSREVVIVSAARTPIGSFQGSLAPLKGTQLGSIAIAAALERAKVEGKDIDEVLMGMVLPAGAGQAPARQAAKGAGLPDSVGAVTLNKVCGSGLKAVMLAAQAIKAGDGEVFVAGGMESMSNVPYLLPGARTGLRMFNKELVDGMVYDGLWDPYNDFHMGNAGELCAEECGIDRERQDEFAADSYRRAQNSIKEGFFAEEIVPVEVPQRKGDPVVVEDDEEPFRGNIEKLPKLRAAFKKDGTVTAGNAPAINDGAAALVVMSKEQADARGLTPLATITGYAGHAQAPEWFTTAPAGAMKTLLDKTGKSVADVDLWEINEAFSVVALANQDKLSIPGERINVRGGAVALGHPIGCSGARILVTLLYAMKQLDKKCGVASLCLGGGEAVALMVER
ncbi:acetyl-CoA C-acyltransferase [Pseudenhygromyxa sp. WMMC2535]|uniref:thiolase family protein n=1 Tax=Pseudenhygromyxa sp. WMMC2535 TaxID=2712867 RepID=UPI001554B0AA|nr:acetyl-CoA C-acyltransferase [Pseudenhygromyxa sp. WMMC2535]NVB41552.1 acetyl-CoA C-acyltransferase [Pseudenhygromyxa sp. WMMC2535]